MNLDPEREAAVMYGQTLEQFRNDTVSYNQDGRLRCGPDGKPSEEELHNRLTATARLLESRAIRNEAGEIANPSLAAARHAIYRAIYTCEATLGVENIDPAQFRTESDYETKTGLSQSDIEKRYAPSMDGPVGNICPETGTDPAITIKKFINEASMDLDYAREDGDKSDTLLVWQALGQVGFIAWDIRENDPGNRLNPVDQTEFDVESGEPIRTDDGSHYVARG